MIDSPGGLSERSPLATREDIVDEARQWPDFIWWTTRTGRMSDLVIPAQMATPDAINFMATHGGLICLALTKDRGEQLGLIR